MCGCLKESRLGECLGTSGEEGTGEQLARALIKPRSEPGRGDTLRVRRNKEH